MHLVRKYPEVDKCVASRTAPARIRMRASLSNAANVHSRGPAELAVERATKAACLLREALALLASDPQNVSLVSARRESDRLLRLPEVQRLTGLRRSAIYGQMQKGHLPAIRQSWESRGDMVGGSHSDLDFRSHRFRFSLNA